MSRRRPKAVALAASVLAALVASSLAAAYWNVASTPGGSGAAAAASLPAGSTPSVSLAGRVATVSWAESSVGGSPLGQRAGGGYAVRRYATSAPSTPIVPTGSCGSLVSGAATPSCTETSLPTGRWRYSVVSRLFDWVGGASAQSTVVVVSPDAPTSVTLTNGTGASSAFVSSVNATALTFAVVLPATSTSGDTVTLTLGDGTSTVTAGASGIDGGGTRNVGGVDASSLADGVITVSARVTSAQGDASPATSATVTKDTVAPTSKLSLASQVPTGSSWLAGSRVFYRGTGGGSGGNVRLSNTMTDAGSGPASSTTAALGGASAGWSHTPGTVSTPTGGPFTSGTFGWAEGTSTAPTEAVRSVDAAGNGTTTTLTFTNDSIAPAGGAIVANGAAAYNTTGTVALTTTPYAETASATASGLAANTVTRATAPLANNVCGTFTGATTVTVSGGNDAATLSVGCYRYTLTGADNVGNVATSTSAVVKVDTTPPAAPTLTFSAAGGSAFYPGSGTQVFFRPAAGASYTLAAAGTDPDTGIAGTSFPSLGTGWTTSGAGTSRTYTSTGGAVEPGARTVTTANNAGAVSAPSAFTTTADATAPAGAALAVNGVAATAGGSVGTSTTGSFSIGTRTDYTETPSPAASGLAASTLTRAQATLAGSTCGTFGSETTLVGSPSQSGLAHGCYRYTLTGTDNVGNAASVVTTVKVDLSPAVTAVVTRNLGTIAGRLQTNDTLAITFSRRMRVSSLCSTWSGDTTNQTLSANNDVTVTVTDGTGSTNDRLTITSGTCTFNFGTLDLGSASYVTGGSATFKGTGANKSQIDWNAATFTLTIELGTKGGAGAVATVASSVATYTPSSAIVDAANGLTVSGPFATSSITQF